MLVVLIFIYMEASSNGFLLKAIIDGNTDNLFVYAIKNLIGLLQLAITWYKIRHAGGQAHYYSRTGTLKQRDVNQ